MASAKGIITFILLAFSAFGVTFSGPLILRIYSATDKFWDLGPIANFIGGGLDIIGGFAQFIILVNMTRSRYFSANANKERARKTFRVMAMVGIIGVIGDLLGGLLGIAAQIGIYVSLINLYSLRQKDSAPAEAIGTSLSSKP